MPDEESKPQEGSKPQEESKPPKESKPPEASQPQKPKGPTYSFQGSSPAESYLDIARIHHKEAKQLLEAAQAAQAEDRREEAKLLFDVAASRKATAEAFERAARGETGDPIVAEILDSQEENREPFVPYAPQFLSEEELIPPEVPVVKDLSLKGRLLSGLAWVGGLISG
jgi:hypothetical protein